MELIKTRVISSGILINKFHQKSYKKFKLPLSGLRNYYIFESI